MSVALKDICTFQSGGTPSKSNPEYFNGSIPWITTVALNGRTIGENNAVDWITDKAIQESAAKIVPAQSIMVGTRVGVGKVAVNSVPMSTSQDIISLVGIDENRWSKDYICKFIQSKGSFLLAQARGATIKGIKIDVLADLQVPEIALEEQRRIVRTLEHLLDSIDIRQKQLDSLDQLIKARFVEMFGDPFVNPMEWEQAIMKSVCKKITDGEHGSVPREAAGHPFLNAKHIKQNGTIDWQTITYTSDEVHKRIYSRCNPEAGDILMTTTGTIGNVAIVPAVEEFSMDRGITLLKLNRTIVSPRFVTWLLRFDAMQMIMTANIHASAIGHLFLNKVEQLPVIVPPMQLQEQFAAFVSQVDKSKLSIQASLDQLETLKQSLMQNYFG